MKKQEQSARALKRNRDKTDALLDSIMFGIKEDQADKVLGASNEEQNVQGSSQQIYEFGSSDNFKKLLAEREVS